MKRTWKQIGSLFLAVCMVLTMLPTMAFAETGDVDSGTPPLGTSGIITAFGSLEPEILAQTVKTGTMEKELNLPGTLAVTVTESVYDIASGSDATKQDTQSTVAVEHWTSDPAYDGDVAGDYTFTPSLALSEGLTVAEGVYAPQITVTVEEAAAPLARGGVALMSGSVTGTMDIGGQTDVGLAANASGTGWAWDATTATLTLNSSYQGGYIKFECAGTDIINLSCTSAVTVNQGSTYAIQSSGSLVIKGDGPLTISDGGIKVSKDIVILGAMGNINSGGSDGISAGGSVTISGTVGDITSTTYAIYANGDITISDGAVVGKIGAGGTGSKSGTHGIYADGSVTIHGTTGNISGMYYGIRANGGDVIIGGKTGAIDCVLSASSDESSGIRAKVSVTITSTGETGAISSKKDYGIYAETGNVLISGTTGDITGAKVFGIYAAAGGITISPSAVVGNIAGAQMGIDADGHVTIGGKTGDITGVTGSIYGGGINANLSVAIYGETGDITSTHPSIPAIGAGGDVSIIGSVGKIAVISSGSGSGCGIYADGGIHIMKSVTVSSFTGAFNKAPATLPFSYTATWSDSVDGTGSSTGSTYTWNASHQYVKIETAPAGGTVTGQLFLGGDDAIVEDLTQDASGTGWTWTASTATLTLTNTTISGSTGVIDFAAAGDVTVTVSGTVNAKGLKHNDSTAGKLTINGSGTLNLDYPYGSDAALYAAAGLEVAGATVNITMTGNALSCIYTATGDVIMSGGTLSMSATGTNVGGIICQSGTINISGTAQVKTSPSVTGNVLNAGNISISGNAIVDVASADDYGIASSGTTTISGGDVTVKCTSRSAFNTDVNVTGGRLLTVADGANGSINGDLTVSGADANVTVNGSIILGGNLTVSAGTVVITGAVSGTTTHTGGTLNGNPPAATYTATLNLQLDGEPSADFYDEFTLKLSTDVTKTVSMAGMGATRTASVPNGTWKVYLGGTEDTGVTITVNNAPSSVTLDWISITSVVRPEGTATGGEIGINGYDSAQLACIKGETLTFTASGKGADSYAYVWSGTHNGNAISSTGNTYKIDSVQGKVYITCTITGSNTTPTTIEITGFEAIPDENVGKAGSTICANVAEVINLLKAIHPYAKAMHSDNQTVLCLITDWEDTDGYNPNKEGSYTFTADVAILPGFANSAGHKVAVEVVVITADDTSDAAIPTITVQPVGATYAQGAAAAALFVTASVSDGGTLSYQWYGSSNSELGGSPISGATAATFTPSTVAVGTMYYHVVVTNTNNATSGNKTAAIYSAQITVTVQSGGGSAGDGSGGSSSGGGGYTPPAATPTPDPDKKPDQPVMATAPVTATAGTNGTASAAIPDKAITDAIAKAQADAKAQGKTANGTTVGLNVTMPKGATSLTATLTQNSLNSLVSAGVSQLELDGAPVSLGLDLNALKEIQKQSNGNISITIAPATGFSNEAKALLGNRPVYSITISYVKDGKTVNVSSLGSGTATLSIPYTPGKSEAVGYLFGVYVDASGKAQRIDGSAYDANSGSLLIPTGHFSVYGVGYTAPSAKFTDIGTHWGKEAIDYVVGRGLLSGTSDTTFAPNTAMTRGMLVTALGRLACVDVKAYTANSFTDVKADSTFRPYIEWAYKNSVVQGIGNQQFAPDRAITREEIAVIYANYAKATGYKLPVTREATAYADASSIGSVYKTAVTAMQQAGIMMGGTGNKFNPKASATRAEVSSMLHRYIKLTIDPATAQGWAKNDAGQYLYYKDGKALTGTQTIDGVKYFFETTGALKTGWVKDGDNWRYYDSNKALAGWWDIGSDSAKKTYYFTEDSLMVSGKWLEIDGKWYYFYTDGVLAKSTKIDGYEVDKNGVRKTK